MIETTEAYGFTFAYPAGDAVVGPCLKRYGEFARITSTVSGTLSRGQSFIDVGANIGAVSLPVSRFARNVIAIEAHPGLAELLQRNVRANQIENITAICAVAGTETATTVQFPVIPLDATANFGAGGAGIDAPLVSVASTNLDSIAPQDTAVLKIDVEGSELDVLRGSEGLLRDAKPSLIVEFNDGHILEYLQDFGYHCYWLWEPFVTPISPKSKWSSKLRGDLSVLARHHTAPQPNEMVRAHAGDSAPKDTSGFKYLHRFGIADHSTG